MGNRIVSFNYYSILHDLLKLIDLDKKLRSFVFLTVKMRCLLLTDFFSSNFSLAMPYVLLLHFSHVNVVSTVLLEYGNGVTELKQTEATKGTFTLTD